MSATFASRIAILIAATILLGACREPNAPAPAAEPAASAAAAPATDAAAPAAAAATVAGAPTRMPAGALDGAEPGQLCNLEFIDGASFGSQASSVRAPFQLRGWLGDDSGATPLDPALVFADDAGPPYAVAVALSVARPDVSQAFPGKSGLGQSGFEARVESSSVPPGRYHVFLGYELGGKRHTCDNGRHIEVLAP